MGNSSGYKVNDDGSVTKVNYGTGGDNHKPSNNSSDNGGCIWGVIIAIAIIVAVFLLKTNSSSSQYKLDNDTIAVVEEVVEEVVVDSVVLINTFPKSSLSDQCSRRRLDETYSGYMLVPNFLPYHKVDDDGWVVYYADNGSYLTSVVLDYDGSAYQFISQLANEMNSTYSAHKEDWAVDSGLYGNQIYYMKAVKSGEKIYCAAFFVP